MINKAEKHLSPIRVILKPVICKSDVVHLNTLKWGHSLGLQWINKKEIYRNIDDIDQINDAYFNLLRTGKADGPNKMSLVRLLTVISIIQSTDMQCNDASGSKISGNEFLNILMVNSG
jgi:predicted neuraminidase